MRFYFRCAFCCLLIVLSVGMTFGQDTSFATGPQYLMNPDPTNHGSPFLARPISTPSLALTAPPLETGASNATEGLVAGADTRTASSQRSPEADLLPLYYGAPPASIIEIGFSENQSELPHEVPASILDTGVWQATTAQALRDRGYGVTPAEAVAYSRMHIRHTTHVYTNADIDRLHGGS
jgi:hypothetical protein